MFLIIFLGNFVVKKYGKFGCNLEDGGEGFSH